MDLVGDIGKRGLLAAGDNLDDSALPNP